MILDVGMETGISSEGQYTIKLCDNTSVSVFIVYPNPQCPQQDI